MGMDATHFADASGYVAEGSVMTARDALLLVLRAQRHPQIASVWWKKQYLMEVKGEHARTDTIKAMNKAVFTDCYRLLGCKTGTLAGRQSVVFVCDGQQGRRYAAAVLGSVPGQRWHDARRLIDKAETAGGAAACGNKDDGDTLRAAGAAVCLLSDGWECELAGLHGVCPFGTSRLLFEKGMDEPCLPASVTKTMTALCMLDFIDDLDTPLVIKGSDLMPGSGPKFNEGDTITCRAALHAMFLPSSNTVAVAISRLVGAMILRST
jgi:D-alanyl-D-alanine carboxypeptidase